MGIPIVQTELGEDIAGATLDVGGRRAIVLNLGGRNRHVFVRRMTIAHELGHVLYDPPRELAQLRVDEFDELDALAERRTDRVEQRANAFGAELLIPQDVALDHYKSQPEDAVGRVMDDFGVSFTTARYQIWNALDRRVPLDALTTDRREPPLHWEAAERYTVDYHPLRDIRPSRAGRFSALVIRATEKGLISWDTAAEWLEASESEMKQAAATIRELFPEVFAT